MKKPISILCLVWLLGCLTLAVAATSSVAPTFKAPKLGEEKTDVQFDPSHLKKPTLVVFWASWCLSCRQEAPELVDLYQKKNANLDIIGISVDQKAEKGAAFVKEAKIPYTNLHDPDAKVAELFHVDATPSLILVDKAGMIRFHGNHLDKEFSAALQEVSGH